MIHIYLSGDTVGFP